MTKCEYKPDCGYAWLVVVACFSINFIMAGLARSAGVMYVAIINNFNVSREVATTPFSLRFCIRCMAGPIIGALGQRFGVRPVVLIGGFVCGIGGIICYFASSVTYITFGWGVVHGIGYGMSNLIHVIVLGHYFDKYKALALGISLTGDCFGTFLLPILLEYILYAYDINGTFLILAAISLNVVPAAMILKSPPWEDPKKENKNYQKCNKKSISGNKQSTHGLDNKAFVDDSDSFVGTPLNNSRNSICKEAKPVLSASKKESLMFPPFSFDSEAVDEIDTIKYPRIMSIPNFYQNNISSAIRNNSCYSLPSEANLQHILHLEGSNISNENNHIIQDHTINEMNRRNSQISNISSKSEDKPTVKELCKSIIHDSLYPQNVHMYNNSKINDTMPSKICNILELHKQDKIEEAMGNDYRRNSQTLIYRNQLTNENNKALLPILENLNYAEETFEHCDTYHQESSAIRQFVKTNIRPIFLLMCLTFACYVFLFISVFTIIIDYASDNGVPVESGKYLLISFSVADLFGRVGFGVVLDRKWIGLANFACLTTGLMGLFVFIMPFSSNFIFWVVLFSLCGFIQGGCAIMYPILTQYYVDKNEESIALGCVNFYGGLLMFPIPAMIGYFRDVVGSYEGVFWTTGGLCIFAGFLWLLEPCIVKKKESIKELIALNNGEVKIHI